MSLLRFDQTTSDWVVFAPSRQLRPHDRERPPPVVDGAVTPACPFCPGQETFTPPEIYAVREGDSRWRVRVFSNKFPALRIEESPRREQEGEGFQCMGGCGAHEVLVESPEHGLFLAQQPIEQVQLVLRSLQLRYQDLMRDRRFQTVIIFKNHGAEAGTSLSHPHWQLIATPVVPRLLRMKHFEASEFFDRTGQCLYCLIREQELTAGKRVLATNADYVAFMPYASHSPFETWIVPRHHNPSYTQVAPERLWTLAELLKIVLLKLYTGLGNPAFNLTIDDVPRGDQDKEYSLWHPAAVGDAGRFRAGQRDVDQHGPAGRCGRVPERSGCRGESRSSPLEEKGNMKSWILLPAMIGMICVSLLQAAEQQAPPAKPKSMMQRKLDHAQQILEGLSLEDYGLIARHAKAMNDLGLLEKSRHAGSMGYQTQLQVFRFATNELVRLAEEKNLDGASLAYTQMTISCVNCHKIIRTLQAE